MATRVWASLESWGPLEFLLKATCADVGLALGRHYRGHPECGLTLRSAESGAETGNWFAPLAVGDLRPQGSRVEMAPAGCD